MSDDAGRSGGGDAFAVLAFRDADGWEVDLLPEALTDDLDGLVAAVRQQPGDSGAFALVNVADEFFVVVRCYLGQVSMLLSDVTAALDWDLAAQVLDSLDLDLPDEDEEEDVQPAGDLGLFADLGLDQMELGAILEDVDAYADETLSVIVARLGFADAYERVVDALVD